MDKNQVIIIGNLGNDPQHFDDPEKPELAILSVATSLQFKSPNGDTREETEWHRVVARGGRAAIARSLRKGDRVYVEGFLHTHKYETEDGEGWVKEIVAQLIYPIRPLPRAEPAERPGVSQPGDGDALPAATPVITRTQEGALY